MSKNPQDDYASQCWDIERTQHLARPFVLMNLCQYSRCYQQLLVPLIKQPISRLPVPLPVDAAVQVALQQLVRRWNRVEVVVRLALATGVNKGTDVLREGGLQRIKVDLLRLLLSLAQAREN